MVIFKWKGIKEINSPLGECVMCPCFFKQPIIKQKNVLITLLQFALPHPRAIFHLDGALPHWGLGVRRPLDAEFPGRLIGRDFQSLQMVYLWIFFPLVM